MATDSSNEDLGAGPEDAQMRSLWRILSIVALIAFVIPAAAIMFLSFTVYRLSARMDEIEVLNKASLIETNYRNVGNFGYAIKEYRELVQASELLLPKARLANIALGQGSAEMRDLAKKTARSVDPDERTWQLNSALSYIAFSDGENKIAIDSGEKAIQQNECDFQSLNNLGWLYATAEDEDIRDLDKAEKCAKKAVECTARNNPNALDTLAQVYIEQNDYESAEQQVQTALASEDVNKYFHDRLRCIRQERDKEEKQRSACVN